MVTTTQRRLQQYLLWDLIEQPVLNLTAVLGLGEQAGLPGFRPDFGHVERKAWPYVHREVKWEDIEEETVRRLCRYIRRLFTIDLAPDRLTASQNSKSRRFSPIWTSKLYRTKHELNQSQLLLYS